VFLADILFYIFSSVLIASALVVVSTKNTVYSVMFLILAFFNAAGLFVLLGAEFFAMLLVIVYVGAIAVLFLFVVMMLNIDNDPGIKDKSKRKFNKYWPISLLITGILLVELIMITNASTAFFDNKIVKDFATPENISNTEALGNILYTKFMYPFQLAGMILFVAMIGAIVLTLREQTRFIRKQNISQQVARNKSDSVEIVSVRKGKGIEI
jgi:NADH-quinone oxidoreductase subunit J